MKTIAVILVLISAALARANATDVDAKYFHPSASMYILGDIPGASNLVAKGLSEFPEDGKLMRLMELLSKPPEQQQDPQDQQQNQQQDQQDQQQDQQQQDQQDPQQQDQQQDPQQDEQSDPQDGQNQQPPPPSEEMTEEEAKMLLDAIREEERAAREKIRVRYGNAKPVEKDW